MDRWQVDNVSGMLTFDDVMIKALIEQHRRALNRDNSICHLSNGWGCGPIVDNFVGLLGAFFRLLGRRDRTPGEYPRDPGDGDAGATNEYFHPIVRIRKRKVGNYKPVSLQGYTEQEPNGIQGRKWVKGQLPPLPEYVLQPGKVMTTAYMEDGTVKYKTQDSLSRLLCPPDILADLDRGNGFGAASKADDAMPAYVIATDGHLSDA
jgi:hypothetical protein